MNKESAAKITRSFKAYKHLGKIIGRIESFGSTKICLGNTGVSFNVSKGDAMWYKLLTTKAALEEELASYEIIQQTNVPSTATPTAVLSDHRPPTGKTPWTEERKAEQSARMRAYWKARRAHVG